MAASCSTCANLVSNGEDSRCHGAPPQPGVLNPDAVWPRITDPASTFCAGWLDGASPWWQSDLSVLEQLLHVLVAALEASPAGVNVEVLKGKKLL